MTDGILIIDKPAGWTSHDVVARARRIMGERRVGHTGTLDPFATGVLVVLVGHATRLAQFLAGAEKEYEALIRFGYATDTGDLTGTRRAQSSADAGGDVEASGDDVRAACASLSETRIEAALVNLRGEIEQTPPMYSAKKVGGKKLYESARRGVKVERAAVRVSVHVFELIRREGVLLSEREDGTCDASARVVCSAGTYVRTLAESLGETLGVGAHLAALRRTRAGAFHITQAKRLEELEEMARGGDVKRALLAPDAALSEMPSVHLTSEEARRVRHGAPVRVGAASAAQDLFEGAHVRMYDEEKNLLAVGVYAAATNQIRPRVLLVAQ